MEARSTVSLVAASLSAVVLLTLSASIAWATAYEYNERNMVPNGVTLAETNLSGMTVEQAREAIKATVEEPMLAPLRVSVEGTSHELNVTSMVAVDIDAMTADALDPRRSASFVERMRHDLAGTPLSGKVEPAYSIDSEVVERWVAEKAETVDRPAEDASITVVGSTIKVTHAIFGKETRSREAVKTITEALKRRGDLDDSSVLITLPVETIRPKITDDKIGKTIVVDVSERRIRLFDGAKLEKIYRCAVGTPQYPTPRGHFKIELLRYLPTWINPAPKGWGADMPRSIAPGPGNPLGTRAINLSAPGIRFHGTTKIGSIGSAASHGCMRMVRSDIEDLYERVYVGMDVYIVP